MTPDILALTSLLTALVICRWHKNGRLYPWLQRLATEPAETATVGLGSFPRLAALAVLVVTAATLLLQRIEPHYFNQDDNFVQFTPVILGASRFFFATGHLPLWNPYQYLGQPVYAISTYALSYPFTYISYAIAHYILGNDLYVLDVFYWLHAVLGFCVMLAILRHFKMHFMLQFLAAACFTFSGYFLIAGRSWYYMIPTLLWLPSLFLVMLKREQLQGYWWLALGGVVGLYFHAGNAQMWVYVMLCCGLYWLWEVARKRQVTLVIDSVCAGLLALAIMTPILLPALEHLAEVSRSGGGGANIAASLAAMFLPGPLVDGADPHGMASVHPETIGQLYYSGTIFTVSAVLCIIWLMGQKAPWQSKRCWQILPWVACLLFSFVAALGGTVWTLLAHLPVLDKFSHPFKFLPLIHFFSIVVGTLFLSWLLHDVPTRYSRLVFAALAVVVTLLLQHHLVRSRTAFYSYLETAYPELSQELYAELSTAQRVFAVAPPRFRGQQYVWSFVHNLGTVYQQQVFSGYDPLCGYSMPNLLINRNLVNKQASLADYGVSHLVLYDPRKQEVQVRKLEHVKPLAYINDAQQTPVSVQVDWQGMYLDLAQLKRPIAADLVVNFAYRKPYTATTEHNTAVPLAADENMRLLVRQDDIGAAQHLAIVYGLRTTKIALLLVAILASLVALRTLQWSLQRRPAPTALPYPAPEKSSTTSPLSV
jgi:hypothetical protein